jgi:TatD DNase family protein
LITDKVIAIGEVGLDYSKDVFDKNIQEDFFLKQIDIARRNNLPVIVHSREAMDDTLELIHRNSDVMFVIHSFSGNKTQTILANSFSNLYFSFNGISTFKNAEEIRESILLIDLHKIMVETDCP